MQELCFDALNSNISSIQVRIKFSSSSHTCTHVSKSIVADLIIFIFSTLSTHYHYIITKFYFQLHLNVLHTAKQMSPYFLLFVSLSISIKFTRLQCTFQQNPSQSELLHIIFLTMCSGSIQQYKLTVDAVVYIILNDALTWFSSLSMRGGNVENVWLNDKLYIHASC